MEFSKKQQKLIDEYKLMNKTDAYLSNMIDELGKLKIRARDNADLLNICMILLAQRLTGVEDPGNFEFMCGDVKVQIVHNWILDTDDSYFKTTEMQMVKGPRDAINQYDRDAKALEKKIKEHLEADPEYCKMIDDLDKTKALRDLEFKALDEKIQIINATRRPDERKFVYKDAKAPSYKVFWEE